MIALKQWYTLSYSLLVPLLISVIELYREEGLVLELFVADDSIPASQKYIG